MPVTRPARSFNAFVRIVALLLLICNVSLGFQAFIATNPRTTGKRLVPTPVSRFVPFQHTSYQSTRKQLDPSHRSSLTQLQALSSFGWISSPLSFVGSIGRLVRYHISTLTTTQRTVWILSLLLSFVMGRFSVWNRWMWTRLTSVQDVSPRHFGPQGPVWRGRALAVSDGDTFRFLHQPTPWHSNELPEGEKLSTACLPIRICTIDTPETAKFGKPGQVRIHT
jgi:hypothetical protein